MPKSDQIMLLVKKHPKWTSRQIGDVCGCHPAYVRAVKARRKQPDRARQLSHDYYCRRVRNNPAKMKLRAQRAVVWRRQKKAEHQAATA